MLQCLVYMLDELARKVSAHASLATFCFRVNYFYISIFRAMEPFVKLYQCMLPGLAVVDLFQRRSRRAEDDVTSMDAVQHQGRVASVIPWGRGVLLV